MASPAAGPALATRTLRALTLTPGHHPRGQAHLSAASGLVCAAGSAYVLADDEHHLARFQGQEAPGLLSRLIEGELPDGKGERKRRKPDFETLCWMPGAGAQGAVLLGLGSCSRPSRRRGVVVPLSARGAPQEDHARDFDLEPLCAALEPHLDALNIEGCFCIGDRVTLLQRGGRGSENLALHYRLRDFLAVVEGRAGRTAPQSATAYRLGRIDGVALGFTDGAALADGRWVFTCVAEDNSDAYADGGCAGAAVGVVGADGRLQSLRRLAEPLKVEGIDARLRAGGIDVVMVTDADDPDQPALLVGARL